MRVFAWAAAALLCGVDASRSLNTPEGGSSSDTIVKITSSGTVRQLQSAADCTVDDAECNEMDLANALQTSVQDSARRAAVPNAAIPPEPPASGTPTAIFNPTHLHAVSTSQLDFQATIRNLVRSTCPEGLDCLADLDLMVPEQAFAYGVFARGAKVICETGFGAGSSAAAFLLGEPNAKVISFDLMTHGWSQPAVALLGKQFPEHVQVIIGNSVTAVPWYITQYPNTRCDVSHVDGSRSAEVAFADIINLGRMSSPNGLLLVSSINNEGPRRAFNQAIMEGRVRGMGCYTVPLRTADGTPTNQNKGYCVGAFLP